MRQVFFQKRLLGAGRVSVLDVPAPQVGPRSVHIRVLASLISTGTELADLRRSAAEAISNRLRDPAQRQDLVRSVRDAGLSKTLAALREKLSHLEPLGYSGAGVAVVVGAEVAGIRPGDLVAYAGCPHAEEVVAGRNLVVPVPQGVSPQEAAFVAVGSIALHAVRQAEVQVGDIVALFGLGLVGLLTVQVATAAGGRVLGIDPLPERRALAKALGAEQCCATDDLVPSRPIFGRKGVDVALICAAADSSEVLRTAARLLRDRGRLVVVGAVPLELPRDLFYYKELHLRMSRSYGPGRYDPTYERDGQRYPEAYVRWSERDNMEEFLRLLHIGKVSVRELIAKEFPVDDAAEAYAWLQSQRPRPIAVLLRYDRLPKPASPRLPAEEVIPAGGDTPARPLRSISPRKTVPAPVRVAILGASHIARRVHGPHLLEDDRVQLAAVSSSNPAIALSFPRPRGHNLRVTTHPKDIFRDPNVDAVVIATHDRAHATLTVDALRHGKAVFCEKPLALELEECRQLWVECAPSDSVCAVGFNRRAAPLAVKLKERLRGVSTHPLFVSYFVYAGKLPEDHWVYQPSTGGGRILGEVCHFVDFVCWLLEERPTEVVAEALGDPRDELRLENVSATLRFPTGSVAKVVYLAAEPHADGKERIEVLGSSLTAVLRDFRHLEILSGKRPERYRRWRQDKGHRGLIRNFISAVLGAEEPLVTWSDGLWATLICRAILLSARQGVAVTLPGSLDALVSDHLRAPAGESSVTALH
jgi:predicted dehydrogenase/threonine dehydrogenase-like Zn-dependent dehydrogenase